MANKTPIGQYNFPEVPSGLDPQLRELLSSIKEWAELREGVTGAHGQDLDRYLTGYSLSELTNVDLFDLTPGGLSYTRLRDSEGEISLQPPTNFTAVKSVFAVYLSWADPDEENLNGIRVMYNTSNDISSAICAAMVPAGNESLMFYPTDLDADHYFWIRAEGFSSKAYSVWVGDGTGDGGGYLVYGYETIDETIQEIMDALQAMDPPAYSGTTTYYAGMHVTYSERIYRCYNDDGGSGISGIAPDAASGPTYWVRDGLIRQGTVDGVDTVGIDAEMVIDGTLYARAIAAGTISASKLVVSDINALELLNGPTTADADATQGALDLGASLDNAKANGVTFITGGYINTDILNVDYSIIVGTKPPADADHTQTILDAGADVTNAVASGTTLISGGYINTDILNVDYSIIVGTKPPTNADNTNDNPQSYGWITGTKPPTDADNTQDQLDLGADISDAIANGYTLISGGYINTSILQVDTAQIVNAAITNAKIENAAVTNAKIGNLAVDTAQIASAAITAAKIDSAAITNAKIANAAVDTAQIANAAITNAKIENAAITNAKIGSAAVDTLQIAGHAVTKYVSAYTTATYTVAQQTEPYPDWVTLQSLTITTEGGDLPIMVSCHLEHRWDAVFEFRVLRGSTVVFDGTGYGIPVDGFLSFFFDDNPSNGTHTYYFQGLRYQTSSPETDVSCRSLISFELMR